MCQIFNSGIGYILVVPRDQVSDTINRIQSFNYKAWEIGSIAKRTDDTAEQIQIDFQGQE